MHPLPMERRPDGSFAINLDWTADLMPPTPAPDTPVRFARASRGRSCPSRTAKLSHSGKSVRIDCPGGVCPI
jgi:hypothetical protein